MRSGTFADWTVHAGRRVQRDAAAVVRGVLGGEPDVGRRAMRFLLTAAEESAAGAALFVADPEARGGWIELRNKLEAFHAFEHVDAILGLPVDYRAVSDLVRAAARLTLPVSVWAAEGVGYHVAAECCRRRVTLHAVLKPAAESVPLWAAIPVHAGIGSALAAHAFDTACADGRDVDGAIDAFEALCATCSGDGYADVTREALGFAVGGMYGAWLAAVAACVRRSRPTLAPLLWHGVGRATYFAPSSALPLATTRRRALDQIVTMSRDRSEQTNAIAGFAWAATMLNLRDPEVLERVATDAVRLGIEAAFARGVRDAIDVWHQCAPGDEAISAFERHRPARSFGRDAWSRVMSPAVRRDAARASELFHVPEASAQYA